MSGPTTRPRITAAVITRNEEKNLDAALASVSWADEVVVVDAFSTDGTVEIARRHGAVVHQAAYPYGVARNKAVELASGEWIFSLDADERCTPEAKDEILRVVADPASADAWYVPRRNFFLGRELRHGGWYPDYRQPQLYRKGAVVYGAEQVHETFQVKGTAGYLSAAIIQVPFRDRAQLAEKVERYSSQGAEKLLAAGRRGGAAVGALHGLAAFLKSWLFRGMFLDGRPGWEISLSGMEVAYRKYRKLGILRRGAGSPRTLHVVEPTLADEAGHCASFVGNLLAALEGRGWQVELWAGRGVSLPSLARPWVRIHPHFGRRLRRFQELLLLRRLLSRPGRILLSTAGRTDLALVGAASGGKPLPPGKATFYFHWLRLTPRKAAFVARRAARQPNLLALGPTPTVTGQLTAAGFGLVRLAPYPVSMSPPSPGGERFRRLLFAGAARVDKGTPLAAGLVELLARTGEGVEVAVQTSPDHLGRHEAAVEPALARLAASPYPGLRLYPETLGREAYGALFDGAVCLQPYRREDFADRVSGVTLDALSRGCPVVASSGTWMARVAERFGCGVAVEGGDPADWWKAASTVAADYPAFHARALEAGKVLLQENSARTLADLVTGEEGQ